MNEHIVIAAQIDWTGGTVYVTDTTLRIDAALLEDGQFEPRILGGVNWGEAARHPYQSQAGELVVGNLTLANADGGLDALATGDVVGAEVELRRGSDADRWADLEFVFVARVSGVRLNGRSEIVLELENILADLAGPVFSDKFASTVPNPQLEGKDIPLVLGRVKQAPVLEFNPTTLTYYTATNASLIGEVAEGGNPTQRWTLEDQPTFNLLGSPSLPITADFEGPATDPWEVILDDNLNTWVSGSDTSLTSPYKLQGNKPSGWTLLKGEDGVISNVVTQDVGMKIPPQSSSFSISTTFNDVTTVNTTSVRVGGSSVSWTNPSNARKGVAGDATITTGGDLTEAIETTSGVFASAQARLEIDHSITSGSIVLDNVQVLKDGRAVYEANLNRNMVSAGLGVTLQGFWDDVRPEDLSNSAQLRLKLKDDVTGDYALDEFYLVGAFPAVPSVYLRRDLSLTTGAYYSVEIDYNCTGSAVLAFGSVGTTSELPDHALWAKARDSQTYTEISGSGTLKSVFKADDPVFGLNWIPTFLTSWSAGETTISRIKITEQKPANTSYKTLAPYILTTAGIDPALHLDQAAINAHADSFGDPDLGWLVKGDETVDQILFRLAGSLGGYVWHGLDGKVRSKRLALPTDPGGTPFTIDSSRADIDEISAFDDPAPQLTTRVNALRNWQPIDPDRQAGITSTWTESDRAAAAADWRITRVYAADADYKRRWAAVESREPYSSALIDATAAQTLANQAGLWANRPRFYEVPTEVLIGELSQVAVGSVVRVELDYPGLDGRWMLVLGREGDARPGTVNLTLWG